MPVNYSNSKIYIIRSEQTDKVFIGATVKRLCERFSQHKSNYERWLANGKKEEQFDPLYDILQFSDARVQLLAKTEDVKDKDDLNSRLIDYINIYKDTAVNKNKTRLKFTPYVSNGKPRGRPRKVKVPDNSPVETPVETTA